MPFQIREREVLWSGHLNWVWVFGMTVYHGSGFEVLMGSTWRARGLSQ